MLSRSIKSRVHKYVYFLVAIGFILFFFPIKDHIEINQSAMIYRNNETAYNEACKISIEGTYKKFLFKENYFRGNIIIQRNDEIVELKSQELSFVDNQAIIDVLNADIPGMSTYFGNIIINDDFSKVLFILTEQYSDYVEWSSDNGLFVTIPSSGRESSLEMIIEMSGKTEWLQDVKWK